MDAMEKAQVEDEQPKRARRISIAVLTFMVILSIVAMSTKSYMATSSSAKNTLSRLFKPASTPQENEGLVTDCGSSRDEALANGCIFDIMYNGWLPPLCHDADLHKEAMQNTTKLASLKAAGPFPWWRDENHTVPIHQDDLWALEEAHAFSWETYHVAHCLYDWRFLVKSINQYLNGQEVWIPERIMDANHIHHCNVVVASQTRRIGARVMVKFGYGKCVRISDTWIGHSR